MVADCFVPGYRNSVGSIREWARQVLAPLLGIFMAAGAALVPREPTPSQGETTLSDKGTSKGADNPPIWWQVAL